MGCIVDVEYGRKQIAELINENQLRCRRNHKLDTSGIKVYCCLERI